MRGGLEESLAARTSAELGADAAQRDFIKAVQRRYHGELLWQEKYRALSLYSTWALIGVNSVIFLGSSVLRTRTERERMDAMSAQPRYNRVPRRQSGLITPFALCQLRSCENERGQKRHSSATTST